jgi:hypothetical protein
MTRAASTPPTDCPRAGVDIGQAGIALFSRAGFAPDLEAAARERGVQLVGLERLLDDLPPG